MTSSSTLSLPLSHISYKPFQFFGASPLSSASPQDSVKSPTDHCTDTTQTDTTDDALTDTDANTSTALFASPQHKPEQYHIDDTKITDIILQPSVSNTSHITPVQSRTTLINKSPSKHTIADFTFGHTIGRGAYSIVVEATRKSDGKKFAIKVCDKSFITKQNKQTNVMTEKRVLTLLEGHPNIVRLYATFQDLQSLYFVMELCDGELYEDIRSIGKYSLELTRFYTAELVVALEYIHRHNAVHRDLKPENILLSKNRHCKLIDFGSSKLMEDCDTPSSIDSRISAGDTDELNKQVRPPQHNNGRRDSFVGTAEYVSPELLEDKPVTHAADLWALGCIVFHMATGRPPFHGNSEYLTFRQILSRTIEWPEDIDDDIRDLCDKLLQLNPSDRIGTLTTGYDDIKKHPLFTGINWYMVSMQPAPAKPAVQCDSVMPARHMDDIHVPALAVSPNSQFAIPPTPLQARTASTSASRRPIERHTAVHVSKSSAPQSLDDTLSLEATASPRTVGEFAPIVPIEMKRPVSAPVVAPTMSSAPALPQAAAPTDKPKPVSQWQQFMGPHEQIVYTSLVVKRRGFYAQKRQLILTSLPRFIYIDPASMQMKKEIVWHDSLTAEKIDDQAFHIRTPDREYYMKGLTSTSQAWIDQINQLQDARLRAKLNNQLSAFHM